jgi:hypothetical protein
LYAAFLKIVLFSKDFGGIGFFLRCRHEPNVDACAFIGAYVVGDRAISLARHQVTPRRASPWIYAFAMMAFHAPVGHASARHISVTSRSRPRSPFLHIATIPGAERKLGESIVAFAMRAEGREVGDGECYSLADQALSNAGAKSASSYTDITPDGDYVWGKPVRLDAARPGDILQFRNFRILRRVTTTLRGADGSVSYTQSQVVEERDHHTAIVTGNFGTSLAIAEQNVEPLGRIVQRNMIAVVPGATTQNDAATGTQTTTEVFIGGDVRAYRPQISAGAPTADLVQSRS